MKKTMAVVAFVWCLAAGVLTWAADPTPVQPPTPDPSPHAGHQMAATPPTWPDCTSTAVPMGR